MKSRIHEQEQEPINVVLIGDKGVGKSQLFNRLVSNKLNSTYEATIGYTYRDRSLPINGDPVKLRVWDTSGDTRYLRTIKPPVRNAHIILIVCDLTKDNPESGIKEWKEFVRQNSNQQALVFFVGIKSELAATQKNNDKFMAPHDPDRFIVSVVSGPSVKELFVQISQRYLEALTKRQVLAPALSDPRMRNGNLSGAVAKWGRALTNGLFVLAGGVFLIAALLYSSGMISLLSALVLTVYSLLSFAAGLGAKITLSLALSKSASKPQEYVDITSGNTKTFINQLNVNGETQFPQAQAVVRQNDNNDESATVNNKVSNVDGNPIQVPMNMGPAYGRGGDNNLT